MQDRESYVGVPHGQDRHSRGGVLPVQDRNRYSHGGVFPVQDHHSRGGVLPAQDRRSHGGVLPAQDRNRHGEVSVMEHDYALTGSRKRRRATSADGGTALDGAETPTGGEALDPSADGRHDTAGPPSVEGCNQVARALKQMGLALPGQATHIWRCSLTWQTDDHGFSSRIREGQLLLVAGLRDAPLSSNAMGWVRYAHEFLQEPCAEFLHTALRTFTTQARKAFRKHQKRLQKDTARLSNAAGLSTTMKEYAANYSKGDAAPCPDCGNPGAHTWRFHISFLSTTSDMATIMERYDEFKLPRQALPTRNALLAHLCT